MPCCLFRKAASPRPSLLEYVLVVGYWPLYFDVAQRSHCAFFSEEDDDLVSLRFHHLVRMIFCLLLLERQFSGRGCTLVPGYTGLQSRTRSKRQQPTCQSEHWAESVVFTPPSWTPNSRLQAQKLEPWNDAFITRGDFDEIHHLEGQEIFDLLYVYLFEKVLGQQG